MLGDRPVLLAVWAAVFVTVQPLLQSHHSHETEAPITEDPAQRRCLGSRLSLTHLNLCGLQVCGGGVVSISNGEGSCER